MNSLLVLRILKEELKKNGYTYKKLAQALGLTEAAIKKQFQSSDISFNRINAICELIGMPVDKLIERGSSLQVKQLKLNKVQENHFIKNPRLFIFFLKLSEERGNVEKANASFQLDSNKLWKFLKTLDDISLIKVHQNNKVELIHGSLVAITNTSLIMEQIIGQLALDFIARHRELNNPSKELKICLLKLSKKNVSQLKMDLNKTYEFYLRQSEIDSYSLPVTEISTHSLLLGLGEFSFV